MAKKSLFEKLGLVEGVAASEYDMPDTTNELRVCSGVGDHYINGDFPEDEPVQVEVPEGDGIDVQPINYDAAREVFPMYSTSSDADIDATYANAKMASWKDNYNILNDTAPMIYNQMCDIWEALGETVNRGLVDTIFDTTYIDALKGDFKSTSAANATTKVTVSDEIRANITQQVTGNLDYDSMLSKTANVTFVPDSSVFTDQASAASVLDDFVNIAKTLDGTMIVINGNINADTQTEFGVQLSANRAQTVANYLASQGIDQNRLIITGSGNAKYQADKAAGALKSDASVYQSTDISFMRIEN